MQPQHTSFPVLKDNDLYLGLAFLCHLSHPWWWGDFSGLPHLELQMCVNGIPPKPGVEAQGWRCRQPPITAERKKASGVSLLCILGANTDR